jgi:hypothetical protein
MRFTVVAVGSALFIPSICAAQRCQGAASFASGSVALGASIEMAGDATGYSGSLSIGEAQGVFVSGSAGIVTVDGIDENVKSVSGSLGYEVALTPTNSATICPVGGVSYEWAEALGIRLTGLTFGGGVSIGGEIPLSPISSLVPFASVGMFRARVKLDDGVDELSTTETYGRFAFGAGLVVNRTFTLQPSVGIPFGLEGADPSFSFSIQINLGAAR